MKKMILEYMTKAYETKAYTNNYIYGFYYKNCIVFSYSKSVIAYVDKAGRECGYSIRFIPNRKVKNQLIKNGYVTLCSKEYFEYLFKTSKYNRGEIFEKLVTEYFGQIWKKDTIPFYKAADITINNTDYQIKFEKATFVNEATLKRL